MNAVCHTADIVTTIVAVNSSNNLVEGNPLLPDPKDQPALFIGVKGSMLWWFDRSARRGYHTEVRIGSGFLCGVALWNVSQMIK